MPRPTVHDIAKNAGVSLATVDRVLNNRPGVRAKTIDRVNEVINQLGYVRDMAAANLARQRDREFFFVVPDGQSSFLQKLRDVIQEVSENPIMDRTKISILQVPINDPHRLATELQELQEGPVAGIAIMALETPQVRDAIGRLKESGRSVVAMISDLPSSDIDQFVGINNVAAGRTAGRLLGSFLGDQTCEVLVIAGSMLAYDHLERRLGFDQIMGERFPHLRILPSLEAWDEADRVERLLTTVLHDHPDIGGIYSIGGGTKGLLRVLEKRGTKDMRVVAHDVTPVSRKALELDIFDAVIEQDVGHVVRSALRIMKAGQNMLNVIPSQEKIRIEVILKENLI